MLPDTCYHQDCDTLLNVNAKVMMEMAYCAGSVVERLVWTRGVDDMLRDQGTRMAAAAATDAHGADVAATAASASAADDAGKASYGPWAAAVSEQQRAFFKLVDGRAYGSRFHENV